MKTIICSFLLFATGCGDYAYNPKLYNAQVIADAYKRKQENLVASFKEAYPDNWEQKLLEYELQQEAQQNQLRALRYQQEFMRQKDSQRQLTAWGYILNQWNENYQRNLDRQNANANAFNAGQAQRRNTYWQEQRARQEYLNNFWKYSNWGK